VEQLCQNLKMQSPKEFYLTCEDYTVSNKKFDLVYNPVFEMLETSPQPKADELPQYYESENYISHTDSRRSIIDRLYQVVKKYTLKKKLNLINTLGTGSKDLLDIGCGTGDFLSVCNNAGWNVVGVEPNEKAQALAKKKVARNNNSEIISELNQIHSRQFDVITLWHVLEHVPNLEAYISTLKSILKPGGFLLVAVPNFKSYDALYYKKFWAAFDVPRHLWHFSKKSIQLLFSNQHMEVIKILPMKFDSFYVSLLSEKNKTGIANFFRAFCIGFLSNAKALKSKEYSSLIYIIKNA